VELPRTYELAWALERAGLTARVVRSAKMGTRQRLFDEFAAALQFPDYFGENWAAFDECLRDLDWLPATSYVLLVTEASRVLDEEPPEELKAFLETLRDVSADWAEEVARGESWDRPPVPFHVLFQDSGVGIDVLAERLKRIGFEIPPILEATS
jgi:hypothetical protein